jgi:hypothetical protein
LRIAAGAIASATKNPVRAAGAGAATTIRAGAPTSTVNDRMLSASSSSLPSRTTRPWRSPGSRPAISNSIRCDSFPRHVTGLTARRA